MKNSHAACGPKCAALALLLPLRRGHDLVAEPTHGLAVRRRLRQLGHLGVVEHALLLLDHDLGLGLLGRLDGHVWVLRGHVVAVALDGGVAGVAVRALVRALLQVHGADVVAQALLRAHVALADGALRLPAHLEGT